jgi:putative redox protein
MSQREDRKDADMEPELDAYKAEILPVNKSRLTWQRDLYFVGTTQRGYEVEFDVKYEEGCSPTETLLLSVAGCLSIDVVHILKKMRCEITSYEMTAEGRRRLTPPQYYESIDLMIHISGKGITPAKIDRAIELSRNKYCSVYHSLRKDLVVNVNYEIG